MNQAARAAAGVALAACSCLACAQSGGDLAKDIVNPFTTVIKVPVELGYDRKVGPVNGGKVYSISLQPVVPFTLDANWSLLSRTIVTMVAQHEIFPEAGRQAGLGDTLQSFFLSPRKETRGGTAWGAGVALLLPTASDDLLGDRKWGAGPTAGVFHDSGPWTVGILANHVWSVAGRGENPISSTFLQPTLSYTTPDDWSYTVQTESTYYWKAREWSVPLAASVGKLIKLGGQHVNVEAGARYWAVHPDSGAKGWGLSFTMTWLFPR